MKPIIILLLSLLPFGAFAGEPAPASAAGEPTVAELSAQLEALKARTSTWDKIASRLPRISGYVQTGYEWSGTSSTFFLPRPSKTISSLIRVFCIVTPSRLARVTIWPALSEPRVTLPTAIRPV